MKYEELLNCCKEALKGFNEKIEGPDSYLENYLKTKTKDSNERMFIKQVYFGVLRYKEFLKAFTDKLFELNRASTERKDEILYQILCYLTIFRLDELPQEDYRGLILSQDYVKINEFFKFIFNPEIQEKVLRPEWIKLYDFMYVDSKLLEGLKKNNENYLDLINLVSSKAYAGNSLASTNDASSNSFNNNNNKLTEKKITIPEPFNLTKPKPRTLLEPISIPCKVEVVPIPDFSKINLDKIEEDHKKRLEETKQTVIKKYEGIKLELETDKRPTNIDRIAEEINKVREAELQFNKKFYYPPIDFNTVPADIKYNEAMILKEDYMIQKKKKDEQDRLNRIIIEKKDSKDFEKWRREMEEKDNIQRYELITKRKIALEMAKEDAINNLEIRRIKNHKKVLEHKKEEAKKLAEKQEMMREEIEEKKKLVDEIKKEERENYKQEKEKAIKQNKDNYLKYQEEKNNLILKCKEERKYEEERRKEIINQIRELEKLPVNRSKGFDPSETAGYCLLEEMSLAELRERLKIRKEYIARFIESKKEENILKNSARVEDLIEKAKLISNERDKLKNQKEMERKNRQLEKENQQKMMNDIREKAVIELKDKISNKKKKKRKEEEEFDKVIREIKLQRQYLQQGRAVVEEKAYKQIEDGIERKMNDKQNKDLIEQQERETVKYGEIVLRYNKAKEDLRLKKKIQDDYENNLASLKIENNEIMEEDRDYKKAMYDKSRDLEKVNKGKINQKLKILNVKESNSHNRSVNIVKNKKEIKDKSDKVREIKDLEERNRFRTEKSFSQKSKKRSASNSLENSKEKNPIYEKMQKEKLAI